MFAAFDRRLVCREVELSFELAGMVATGAAFFEDRHDIVIKAHRFLFRPGEYNPKNQK